MKLHVKDAKHNLYGGLLFRRRSTVLAVYLSFSLQKLPNECSLSWSVRFHNHRPEKAHLIFYSHNTKKPSSSPVSDIISLLKSTTTLQTHFNKIIVILSVHFPAGLANKLFCSRRTHDDFDQFQPSRVFVG
ncbi:hypothetical protein RF11_14195 [Thelohanellus kitauei]|uniref:Uncharacterized protein n=1 Tax=Thelohanellus kitauei TaxID=669202 RepID=A0A0C2JWF1_THEKT|nr:hypothetical protein RF11_14195 [Thelohanellus kitauei]